MYIQEVQGWRRTRALATREPCRRVQLAPDSRCRRRSYTTVSYTGQDGNVTAAARPARIATGERLRPTLDVFLSTLAWMPSEAPAKDSECVKRLREEDDAVSGRSGSATRKSRSRPARARGYAPGRTHDRRAGPTRNSATGPCESTRQHLLLLYAGSPYVSPPQLRS